MKTPPFFFFLVTLGSSSSAIFLSKVSRMTEFQANVDSTINLLSKNDTSTTGTTEAGWKDVPGMYNALINGKEISNTTADDMEVMYPVSWKSQINYDPMTATYIQDFMADPVEETKKLDLAREAARKEHGDDFVDDILYSTSHHALKRHRRFDFRLSQDEVEKFQKQGIVVSKRLSVKSFAEGYYRLYSDDLPVFITSDSVLHAWHRGYDAVLKEIEVHCFSKSLSALLATVHSTLRGAMKERSRMVTCSMAQQALVDADLYLTIAQKLLLPTTTTDSSVKNFVPENDNRVSEIMEKIAAQDGIESLMLFGKSRKIDFSQFKPRGHYTTDELKPYFQSMMWLGRIDFRLTGSESNTRQLHGALMLLYLLKRSEGGIDTWRKIDETLKLFVGPVDSVTFDALDSIIENHFTQEQVWNVSEDVLTDLQSKLLLCGYTQGINSHMRDASDEEDLPLSLSFFGQRFTIDSFAMSQSVYGQLKWKGQKVQRRVPSGLDVAFSVLENDNAVPELVRRIRDGSEKSAFRDGLPVAHSFVATRKVVESVSKNTRESTIYSMWLNALQQLSTTPSHTSDGFSTEGWAMRVLNTQLASLTELKHDTVLYAKQGFSMSTMCEYPAGFVEPSVKFWTAMEEMAVQTSKFLEDLDLYDDAIRPEGTPLWVDLPSRAGHVEYFAQFGKIIGTLKQIALSQESKTELTEEQAEFLRNVMEETKGSGGTRYKGWYPKLFYSSREDSGKDDALVADVFTNTPDAIAGDPGCVLHQATGDVYTSFVAVNFGTDQSPSPVMFAGPVFSYYEFQTPSGQRLDDSEWKEKLQKRAEPSHPDWATKTYLAA